VFSVQDQPDRHPDTEPIGSKSGHREEGPRGRGPSPNTEQ